MAQVKRLFFGLWPDQAVRQQLATLSRRYRPRGSRAVPEYNLHATLVFLGSTPEERIPDIIEAAGSVQTQLFTLVMQQLEVWRRPQVLCLCPESVPAELQRLHKDLVAALAQREIASHERVYRPHVTLARKVRKKLPVSAIDHPIEWTLERFSLIESVSTEHGVSYIPLHSW